MIKTYDVVRQHLGDRMYMPGEKREASEGDVAHLVANGVLTEKAEAKPKNKAEPKVENKGER